MTTKQTIEKEHRTDNTGLEKVAVQWLNEVQFFNQTLAQVDSFVLRNRQFWVTAKRNMHAKKKKIIRFTQPHRQCKSLGNINEYKLT